MNRRDLDQLAKALKGAKPDSGAAGDGWQEAVEAIAEKCIGGATAQRIFLARCGLKEAP